MGVVHVHSCFKLSCVCCAVPLGTHHCDTTPRTPRKPPLLQNMKTYKQHSCIPNQRPRPGHFRSACVGQESHYLASCQNACCVQHQQPDTIHKNERTQTHGPHHKQRLLIHILPHCTCTQKLRKQNCSEPACRHKHTGIPTHADTWGCNTMVTTSSQCKPAQVAQRHPCNLLQVPSRFEMLAVWQASSPMHCERVHTVNTHKWSVNNHPAYARMKGVAA